MESKVQSRDRIIHVVFCHGLGSRHGSVPSVLGGQCGIRELMICGGLDVSHDFSF